jgi:hypothetical protein
VIAEAAGVPPNVAFVLSYQPLTVAIPFVKLLSKERQYLSDRIGTLVFVKCTNLFSSNCSAGAHVVDATKLKPPTSESVTHAVVPKALATGSLLRCVLRYRLYWFIVDF